MVNAQVERITPGIAARYLEANMQNQRPISHRRIATYAAEMQRGDWTLGDSIKFTSNGRMVDGQHRLMAVVKAGCAVDFIVLRDFPEEGVPNLDTGLVRSASHTAAVQGVKMGNEHAATIKMLFAFNASVPPSRIKDFLPKREIVRLFLKHEERLLFACHRYGNSSRGYAGVRAVIARAWGHEDHAALRRFLEVWDTRMSLSANELAIVRLRNNYDATPGKAGNALSFSFFYQTQSVLRAYLNDRGLTSIRETTKNLWPFPEFDHAVLADHGLLRTED
jgi:hypothetical protein